MIRAPPFMALLSAFLVVAILGAVLALIGASVIASN